jgi:CRISPR-associated exonuclease Cas4
VFPIIVVLLILALLAWFFSQRANTATGLPQGEVVYTDTGGWGRLEKPLVSQRLQLVGKPDYLVRDGNSYIPVEVKSGNAPPRGPYDSHIYQLAAYCALVTEAYGRRPSHGLIKYVDKTLMVDYTSELENDLLDLLGAIQEDSEADDVSRSHNSVARCRGCGFKEVCEESLSDA